MDLELTQRYLLNNIKANLPLIGLRCPLIGKGQDCFQWQYSLFNETSINFYNGFYVGKLWLAYALTGESCFKNCARMHMRFLKDILKQHKKISLVEEQSFLQNNLGQIFCLSVIQDFRLTGSAESRDLALRAADELRSYFNWQGRFLLAKRDSGYWLKDAQKSQSSNFFCANSICIESMQSLPLLFFATAETNVQSYANVALDHALSSLKYLIRPDCSTYQFFEFDREDNKTSKGFNPYGLSDDSCWSRGQAIALYGFTQLSLYQFDKSFWQVACKLADFVLVKLGNCASIIPYWDFSIIDSAQGKDTSFQQVKDSSAGAIICVALFALAYMLRQRNKDLKQTQTQVSDFLASLVLFHKEEKAEKEEEKQKEEQIADEPFLKLANFYEAYAFKLLSALQEQCDIAQKTNSQGFLKHGCFNMNFAQLDPISNMQYADAMLPCGDYFYFEAVLRALGMHDLFSVC